VFCQCGFEGLKKCSKIGHARRMGNFTREINDECLNQFWSDCKVLWMTLKQLVETFIKLPIFDSSRAICVLFRGQNQLLVPSGWGKARKTSKKLQDSFPWSHWIEQKCRQNFSERYINNMPKAFSWNTHFMSNLHAETCHFTSKSIGDQPRSFANFALLLFVPFTRSRSTSCMRKWQTVLRILPEESQLVDIRLSSSLQTTRVSLLQDFFFVLFF